MAKASVGIIGKGRVGSALRQGSERGGYEVRTVGNDPSAVRATAEWAQIVILAVPYSAVEVALGRIGTAADGKVLVDVTNAVARNLGPALDLATESSAERTQALAPATRVVKAFNTAFAANMSTGQVRGQQLSVFVAGDDDEARKAILALGWAIGFDPVDCGPLENARWIEAMAILNMRIGLAGGLGTEIGFRLIHG